MSPGACLTTGSDQLIPEELAGALLSESSGEVVLRRGKKVS